MNSRRWLVHSAFAVAVIATVVPPAAFAGHAIVRPDGSGDYPNINTALFSMVEDRNIDTLIVEPGFYDEIVTDLYCVSRVVYGRAGADSTHVRGFDPNDCRSYGCKVVGITIDTHFGCPSQAGASYWTGNCAGWTFDRCVFAQGFEGYGSFSAPTRRCTFRGSAAFHGFNDLADCVFDSASTYFENGIGYVMVARCTFKGPSDDLVTANPRDESGVNFVDCTFSDAGDAIRLSPYRLAYQSLDVRRCRFEHLTGSAIEYLYDDGGSPQPYDFDLTIDSSFVFDVGRAVRARSSLMLDVSMLDDTIATTHDTAIDATVRTGYFHGLDVSDAGGMGMHLSVENFEPSLYGGVNSGATVDLNGCHVWNARSDGVKIEQLPNPTWDPDQRVVVSQSNLELNAGAGLTAEAPRLAVTECLFRGNGADGADLLADGGAPACSLVTTTAVENAGRGIVVESPGVVALSLDHDLVTRNGLDGLAVTGAYSGHASFNDAWANRGVPFVGLALAEINLQRDPRYCDEAAGDFDLSSDSPCAPAGVYGRIGARGVGCSPTTAVPAFAPVAGVVRATPNPARGTISFTTGAGSRIEELTVFDLLGRRRWSAPGGALAGGVVRWEGGDDAGTRLPPGVYLVRWRTDAREGSSRFILLDR